MGVHRHAAERAMAERHTDKAGRHIGILGGTFDPIHNAHLALGEAAMKQFSLDELWFMPDCNPPHKRQQQKSDTRHRCRMTALAVEGHPGFVCSLFEQSREGFTYTADTLAALRESYPNDSFYFIMGADSLFELESWYHPENIMALACILVAVRTYESANVALEEAVAALRRKYHADIRLLDCPPMDISSTQIRRLVAEGRSLQGLVPPAVEAYIRSEHLYQQGGAHEV